VRQRAFLILGQITGRGLHLGLLGALVQLGDHALDLLRFKQALGHKLLHRRDGLGPGPVGELFDLNPRLGRRRGPLGFRERCLLQFGEFRWPGFGARVSGLGCRVPGARVLGPGWLIADC
jgi:hypothetical protein